MVGYFQIYFISQDKFFYFSTYANKCKFEPTACRLPLKDQIINLSRNSFVTFPLWTRSRWRARFVFPLSIYTKVFIIYFIGDPLACNRYSSLVMRVDHKHQTFVILYLLKWLKSDRYDDLRVGGQRFGHEIQIDGEVGFVLVRAFESTLR